MKVFITEQKEQDSDLGNWNITKHKKSRFIK